jgi:hypothetical protein
MSRVGDPRELWRSALGPYFSRVFETNDHPDDIAEAIISESADAVIDKDWWSRFIVSVREDYRSYKKN